MATSKTMPWKVVLEECEVFINSCFHFCTRASLSEDKILLERLGKKKGDSRFNIQIPFSDMDAFYFGQRDNGSLIVVRPVQVSYKKFCDAFSITHTSIIPEYFLSLIFTNKFNPKQLEQINLTLRRHYVRYNSFDKEKTQQLTDKLQKQASSNESCEPVNEDACIELITISEDEDEAEADNSTADTPANMNNGVNGASSAMQWLIPTEIVYKDIPFFLHEPNMLNDHIMEYYTKNLRKRLDDKIKERIKIFPTFMSDLLLASLKSDLESHVSLSLSQMTERIRRHTSRANFFDNEIWVVPLNLDFHWFLVIVTNVDVLLKNDYSKRRPLNSEQKKLTVILCDSFPEKFGDSSRERIKADIHRFICDALGVMNNSDNSYFTISCIKFVCPTLPVQPNAYDCGLFTLEFIERFFENPDAIIEKLCRNQLANWFVPKTMKVTRAGIERMIRSQVQNPAELENLDRYISQKKRKFTIKRVKLG